MKKSHYKTVRMHIFLVLYKDMNKNLPEKALNFDSSQHFLQKSVTSSEL